MTARSLPVPLMLATALAVVAVDAATKQAATRWLPIDGLAVGPGVRLEASENTGIAFGFLSGAGAAVVIVVLVGVGALLAVLLTGRHLGVPAAAAALVVGGALANLTDRLGDGAVADFIEIGPWPRFNLADAAITVGVAWWFLATWRKPAQAGSSAASPPPP